MKKHVVILPKRQRVPTSTYLDITVRFRLFHLNSFNAVPQLLLGSNAFFSSYDVSLTHTSFLINP